MGHSIETVELAWCLQPKGPGVRPFRFVRSEGREFPPPRYMVPASEFHVRRGERTWRCTLVDGDWFYLAGIWRAGEDKWPASYAILTTEANTGGRALSRSYRSLHSPRPTNATARCE